MTRYSHTQRSYWTAYIAVPVGAILVGTAVFADPFPLLARLSILTAAALIAWILHIFSRLTVLVDPGVEVHFGSGWPRKRIDPSTITGVTVVRTSWLTGWGIRWVPGGTLWNVYGRDAVELTRGDARRFLIGTDEPEALARAIESVAGIA